MNYAGFWQRFFALILDGIIISVVSMLIGVVLSLVMGDAATNLNTVLQLIIGIGYWVFYQQKEGQTLGKKALGIKVVNASGKTPDLMTFFLREIIGKFVDALTIGVGYLWMLWDPKKQCLHDKIASTYVIRV